MKIYSEYDDLIEKMKSPYNFEKWQKLNMNMTCGKDEEDIILCLKQLNSEIAYLKQEIDDKSAKDFVICSISSNLRKVTKLLIKNGWKM